MMSYLSPKRPMEQRLEQVLRLALGLALLDAQPLEFVGDVGELLLEGNGWNRYLQRLERSGIYERICSAPATHVSNPIKEIREKRGEVLWDNCRSIDSNSHQIGPNYGRMLCRVCYTHAPDGACSRNQDITVLYRVPRKVSILRQRNEQRSPLSKLVLSYVIDTPNWYSFFHVFMSLE